MTTLERVQNLVDQLDLLDQVRLLEYLAPRIVGKVQAATSSASSTAWQAFFQMGNDVSALDTPESETLTAAIATLRR